MHFIQKAYGYVTRTHQGIPQVLVFRHPLLLATERGIQIPKGTVQENEMPLEAVRREIIEETGLTTFTIEREIATDTWEYSEEGRHELHERHFFLLTIQDAPDEWDHAVTGDGEDEGMIFHYFWISSADEIVIASGHGDYLDAILKPREIGTA